MGDIKEARPQHFSDGHRFRTCTTFTSPRPILLTYFIVAIPSIKNPSLQYVCEGVTRKETTTGAWVGGGLAQE